MRPRVTSLSLSPDKWQHDASTHRLKECRLIDVVRSKGPLFFANSSYLETQIARHSQNKPDLKHILLVADGINDMDASGQETLSLMVDQRDLSTPLRGHISTTGQRLHQGESGRQRTCPKATSSSL